jgi:glutamate racemase
LIKQKIESLLTRKIHVVAQGDIVARSLKDYLHRHPEIEKQVSKNKSLHFFTTDAAEDFAGHAGIFYGRKLTATHVEL